MAKIEIKEEVERWNDYLLEDGTRLRIKNILIWVNRVEGEYNEDGNPRYILKTQIISDVIAPEALKRKPS